MSTLKDFKRTLSSVTGLLKKRKYDLALAKVTGLLEAWPGNSSLYRLWARLVELQENPDNSLDEVEAALRRAVELDEDSPAGPIELGHFLDAVKDEPQDALDAHTQGVSVARRLLIEGLIGQVNALRQLGRPKEFHDCLLKLLRLTQFEQGSNGSAPEESSSDIIFESPTGRVYAFQLNGPYAKEIEEILEGMRSGHSV